MQLPGGFCVKNKNSEDLVFYKLQAKTSALLHAKKEQYVKLNVPGKTIFNEFIIQATITDQSSYDYAEKNTKAKNQYKEQECFDLDKIKLPLTIRFRKTGDKFVPFGQQSLKKVGKFLTAQKVPEEIRDNVLVIEDSEKIIWLYPIRICEQSKITKQTQNILQIKISKTNESQ